MLNLKYLLSFWALLGILDRAQSFLPLMGEESECDMECDPDPLPVCGNDGRTYDSRCDIERAKCQGHPVEFKHRGRCTDKGRCEAQRNLMLEQKDRGGHFVPDCRPDGSYAEVQCHRSTGYCWCVDEAGKPIQGSSIQNARPNCSQKRKKMNRRRSSRGKKNRKGCGTNDRASFNANLIDIFQSEYDRVPQTTTSTASPTQSDPLRDTHEKQVIQWKFDQLDGNNDSFLRKKEIRDLRRMAKKIVKPKMCAKTFAKFCDLDQDKRISRSEWSVCVGVDINNEQVNAVAGFLDDSPKEEETSSEALPVKPDTWDRDPQMPRLRHDGHSTAKADSFEDDTKEDPQDCQTARHVAQEQHEQNPNAGIYVPECEGAQYARAQCHRDQQYCWCVHPRSGKPVRGTATQGYRPDCVKRAANNIKGCALHKKQEFLDELVQSFIKEMQEDAKNRSASIEMPTAEKAARWKFSTIDENTNSMLDKREWKLFKREWRNFQRGGERNKKKLRKCWRNLPRFCDENDDHRISMDEWLVCTSVTRDAKNGLPRNPQRKGKNPFSTILKSD